MGWRYVEPRESVDPKLVEELCAGIFEPAEPSVERAQALSTQEARREIHRRMRVFARDIRRVWAIRAIDVQARSTEALAERAAEASVELCALPDEAVVRLGRLLVRHFFRLSPDVRERAISALAWPRLRGRELGDLVYEAAQIGCRTLTCCLADLNELRDLHQDHPKLGAQLATILDRSKNFAVHHSAARFLACGRWPDAAPALRRELRRPYLLARPIVVDQLAEAGWLTDKDMLWLLEEIADHPPNTDLGVRVVERGDAYEVALTKALRAVQPKGGEVPLLRIACGKAAAPPESGIRGVLGEAWALHALAIGYPATALPLIDRRLVHPFAWMRGVAVAAAGELPDELALPRLYSAAGDPDPDVAERARRLWEQRTERVFDGDVDGELALHLLDGPPSARFRERLAVLRGRSAQARLALLEALLAEAPDPEALVLITFALQADSTLPHHELRPSLPRSARDWAAALFDAFGARAGEALLHIASRRMGGYILGTWLSALLPVLDRLPPEAPAFLQRRAMEQLYSPFDWDWNEALDVLNKVGVPAEAAPRLWELAGEARWPFHLYDALVRVPGDFIDERLREHLESRLRECDWKEAGWLLGIGLSRQTPGMVERAMALLESTNEGLLAALTGACEKLTKAGHIDEAWMLRALGDLESERFFVGVTSAWARRDHSDAVRAALFRALDSTARSGRSAAEAAGVLVLHEVISWDDPRLPTVLERAAPVARAELLQQIACMNPPFEFLAPWVAPLLCCDDQDAAVRATSCLPLRDPRTKQLFADVFDEVRFREVRNALAASLRRRQEIPIEPYWVDENEPFGEEEDARVLASIRS